MICGNLLINNLMYQHRMLIAITWYDKKPLNITHSLHKCSIQEN